MPLRTNLLKGLKSKRTAMLSGWAMQPGAKYRYRVDAMIPFSDHADHPGPDGMHPAGAPAPRSNGPRFRQGIRRGTPRPQDRRMVRRRRRPTRTADPAPGPPPARHRARHGTNAWSARSRTSATSAAWSTETGSRVAKAEFLTSYLAGLESDDDLRTAVLWLDGENP